MRRYNDSYRIICSNIAIGTIDKQEYELLRAAKRHFPLLRATFHGNGVVKTVTVESYELYKQVRADYKARTQA